MGIKVAMFALMAVSASASTIYAISSSDEGQKAQQDLYLVDPITGVLTMVAPVTFNAHPLDLESLAFTPSLGLYGVAHGVLFRVNAGDGDATAVGDTGVALAAIVYGPNGVMYGTSGNRLYTVDLATGAAKLIGMGKEGQVESLEFDGSGALYAVVDEGRNSSLYLIDTSTGSSTLIGKKGGIGFDEVTGLTFIGGTMYAFTEDGIEISVDLNNGSGTFLQNVAAGLEATAVDPPAVPEPATIGLAGIALLALFVARRVKLRKQSPPPASPATP